MKTKTKTSKILLEIKLLSLINLKTTVFDTSLKIKTVLKVIRLSI